MDLRRPNPTLMSQRSLFSDAQVGPPGFDYQPEFIGADAASALILAIAQMPLAEAEYKQYRAHRRVLHFGGRYDYTQNLFPPPNPSPPIFIPLSHRLATP